MADFSFSEDPEIQKLAAQVVADPEEFDNWEKLVRAAESQEGGLHRNSSPQAIASTRDTYDQFLARFPLFYGFWKRYADLEFAIAGTEAAEMVYERGIASIGVSVDLWTNYCSFKVETSHDADVIRELFERGAESCGLDFLAHPFWDKYLEFEERLEDHGRIFAILGRIIHYPLHQYSRYFERYRTMAPQRDLSEVAPAEILSQFKAELASSMGAAAPLEVERELRSKLDAYYLEIFGRTQVEVTKRWTYEQNIKRPYYHVTELDEEQLVNWNKYLDFEETEGDYSRAKFLYERCLVTAANYDDFWFRYARWMLAQPNKTEEVRNICQRASCIYVPIARPAIRIFYANFEEAQGRADVAIAIHEAILLVLQDHLEALKSLINLYRRRYGIEAAINILQEYVGGAECSVETRGALVAEWARIVWRSNGDIDGARKLFQINQHQYLESAAFWHSWLSFEIEQPSPTEQDGSRVHERIKAVHDTIRQQAKLEPLVAKQLSDLYTRYLEERGGKDAMRELVALDVEVNGPRNGQTALSKASMENGHGHGAEEPSALPRSSAGAYGKYQS